jgi:hypothetical protein
LASSPGGYAVTFEEAKAQFRITGGGGAGYGVSVRATLIAAAEAALTQAISDRRRHLVEENVNADSTHHPRDVVSGARDHRDGLTDAIGELDQRIIAAEATLAEKPPLR